MTTPPTLTDHLRTFCLSLGIHGEQIPFTDPPRIRLASADEVELVAEHCATSVGEESPGVYGAVATIAGQRVAFVSPVPKVVVRR